MTSDADLTPIHQGGEALNRRGLMKVMGAAGLGLCLPSGLMACGGEGQAVSGGKAATVNQGWIRQFAPAAVSAKELEFLNASGQTAELVDFTRGLDGLVAMQGGDVDYTAYLVGYTHLIQAIIEGIPVKAVAGSGSGISELLIRTELATELDEENMAYSGDEAWELLRGRKLGGARGSTQEFIARSYLRVHGMDFEKDIEFVDLKSNTDQLIALRRGDVDAIVTIVPSATDARVKGYAALLAHPYDAGEFTRINTALMIRESLLEDAPETVESIVRAHIKAIDFYNADAAKWVKDTAEVALFDEQVVTHLLNPESLGLDASRWQNVSLDYTLPVAAFQKLARELYAAEFVTEDVSDRIPEAVDLSILAKVTGKSEAELSS